MPKTKFEYRSGDLVRINDPRIARDWTVERVIAGRADLFRFVGRGWVRTSRLVEQLSLIGREDKPFYDLPA